MFKKLLDLGNRYAEKSTWKDFALVKFCLFSMGMIAGSLTPKKHRRKVIGACSAVFSLTYIPLMVKLFRTALKKEDA